MFDRILYSSLRLTIASLTVAAGVGSLLLAFWGLLKCMTGQPIAGSTMVAGSLLPGIAAYHLAAHREDLIGF